MWNEWTVADREAWNDDAAAWWSAVIDHELPRRFLDWPCLGKHAVSSEVSWRVAAWYRSQPERFVEWVLAEVYRPSTGDAGGWRVRWTRIEAVVTWALREVRDAMAREDDAGLYTTLDRWLKALAARRLEGRAPVEPSAKHVLKARWLPEEPYRAMRARIQRRLPRTCKGCGAEFRWETAEETWRRPSRCPACREHPTVSRRPSSPRRGGHHDT
jgi:hypothetical protein